MLTVGCSTTSYSVDKYEYPRYRHGLALGVGSGNLSSTEIDNISAGRFQVVCTFGIGRGVSFDLVRAFIGNASYNNEVRNTIDIGITIDNYVVHSAGSFIEPYKTYNLIFLDPAAYGLPKDDIDHPGIVSCLSGVGFKFVAGSGEPTITPDVTPETEFGEVRGGAVSYHFTFNKGFPIKEFLCEYMISLFGFGKCLSQTVIRTIKWPFSNRSPFKSHNIGPMLDKLEYEGRIPRKGTYRHLDIYYFNGNNWDKTTIR